MRVWRERFRPTVNGVKFTSDRTRIFLRFISYHASKNRQFKPINNSLQLAYTNTSIQNATHRRFNGKREFTTLTKSRSALSILDTTHIRSPKRGHQEIPTRPLSMGIFSSKPVQPASIPTDKVVPLHSLDDTKIMRALVVDLTLCFDEVLDPERLRDSLEELLNHWNWRKLGARLRLNKNGKLEYHIPAQFDAKRPAFAYSHVKLDCKTKDHPLASKLPHATAAPTLQPNAELFRGLSRDSNSPEKLEDWLTTDIPQLFIHIVSFKDGTMVTMTAPHSLMDAMARIELFKCWIMSLNGRLDSVPDLYGFDFDPLEKLGQKATESSVLDPYRITGFRLFLFIVNYIIQSFGQKQTIKTICISPTALKKLKSQALAEVQAFDPKAFISDGDVISAWWAKLGTLHIAKSKNRMVTILNTYNLRSLLAKSYPNPNSTPLIPEGKPYIANTTDAIYALIPSHELLAKPLGYIALAIRKAIQAQATRAQVEAVAAMRWNSRTPPVFGRNNSFMLVLSNRSKAKFYDVFDFSKAVVNSKELAFDESKLVERVGKPAFIYTHAFMNDGVQLRNAGTFEGPDGNGNFWLFVSLDDKNWDGVQEALDREWSSSV